MSQLTSSEKLRLTVYIAAIVICGIVWVWALVSMFTTGTGFLTGFILMFIISMALILPLIFLMKALKIEDIKPIK